MRHTLDSSAHTGAGNRIEGQGLDDLELVGMLPAEIRRLAQAWRLLTFAAEPARGSQIGTRHGSTESSIPDAGRSALRTFRNTKRMEISRLADEIVKRVRDIKRCKTCNAENSRDDLYCSTCGALFPITCPKCKASNDQAASECHRCGEKLGKVSSRTRSADA
jgi:ribosomal protein L40E